MATQKDVRKKMLTMGITLYSSSGDFTPDDIMRHLHEIGKTKKRRKGAVINKIIKKRKKR